MLPAPKAKAGDDRNTIAIPQDRRKVKEGLKEAIEDIFVGFELLL